MLQRLQKQQVQRKNRFAGKLLLVVFLKKKNKCLTSNTWLFINKINKLTTEISFHVFCYVMFLTVPEFPFKGEQQEFADFSLIIKNYHK